MIEPAQKGGTDQTTGLSPTGKEKNRLVGWWVDPQKLGFDWFNEQKSIGIQLVKGSSILCDLWGAIENGKSMKKSRGMDGKKLNQLVDRLSHYYPIIYRVL